MDPTPVMSTHARERCAEMGISTKVAKQIVKHADVDRPTCDDPQRRVMTSRTHPDYAVVVVADRTPPLVVTVLFNTVQPYARAGATFSPVGLR